MAIVQFVPWVFGLFMGVGIFLPVDLAAVAQAQEAPKIPPPPSPSSKPESVKPSKEGVVTPSQDQPVNPSLPSPSPMPEPLKPSKEGVVTPSQEQPVNPSLPSPSPTPALQKPAKDRLITLDFNNVDLPVFVKFVSEIIGKNFIIDERVRGKVTIFSPSKISVDKVYQVFQSVMEIKGLTAVPTGEMIQILPASEVPPERDINVYYLENANAEEAAKLLTSLATRTAAPPPVAGRPAGRPPGEFEGTVQIIPDKATNALLITASPKDYEMLKEVIKKIDVRRRQVYVEAVIMEVAQDKLRQLGTQLGALGGYQTNNQNVTIYGSANEDLSELANLTNITGVAGGTGGGLNLALSTINVKILLSALESATDTNVLSTPQILTTNNQKAKIVVAQNVPFITGNNQTVGGVTQTQITRQDVGVTLELTPEILEGDRVRMDVRQEISSLADTPQAVLIQLGPTTNKREATTTVIVDNHQTVVIGGLMRDDINNTTTKIPLLGDIPLIGWLFKYQSKHVTKANLLIFLTPHVVHDNNDLDELRQQKTEYMKTHLVKEALRDQTLTGEFLNSINPPRNKR